MCSLSGEETEKIVPSTHQTQKETLLLFLTLYKKTLVEPTENDALQVVMNKYACNLNDSSDSVRTNSEKSTLQSIDENKNTEAVDSCVNELIERMDIDGTANNTLVCYNNSVGIDNFREVQSWEQQVKDLNNFDSFYG